MAEDFDRAGADEALAHLAAAQAYLDGFPDLLVTAARLSEVTNDLQNWTADRLLAGMTSKKPAD